MPARPAQLAGPLPMSDLEAVIQKLNANRVLAHQFLFPHRHHDKTPFFHADIISRWHGPAPFSMMMAFRGAGKSTLSEEAIIIEALLSQFHNGLIIGESHDRAVERLAAIKFELEQNDTITSIFGPMVGPIWQSAKVELANGVVIQAMGRGQSLRGAKHLDRRPDRVFCDDLEDEESVATPESRKKTVSWFTKALLPALAPGAKVRVAATPLDRAALAVVLFNDPAWRDASVKVPIERANPETGEPESLWPERFPLSKIHELRDAYRRLGQMDAYMQEYMCEAEDASTKVFTAAMLRVEPTVRTWQPVYAFYDPARTTNTKSATTGRAIWSWVGHRLIIWELDGAVLKPDEMIDDMFRVDDTYNPIAIGVEEDGLNEFILQPLRQRQVDRSHPLPVRAMRAPKGKLDFIKSLQPFFKAGEVIFTQPFAAAWEQFLSYPSGRIDAPNALAYALTMRPGAPIYDAFHGENIAAGLDIRRGDTLWLAVNATPTHCTAALCQLVAGQVRIYADWMREGDPGTVVASIIQAASMEAGGRSIRCVAPADHFSQYDRVGLKAALRKIPVKDLWKGGPIHVGREELRALLGRMVGGRPGLAVDERATWSLRAFTGGYARSMARGVVADFPAEGPYRTLMEGIEAFAALKRVGTEQDDSEANWAYTPDGRRYRSARG